MNGKIQTGSHHEHKTIIKPSQGRYTTSFVFATVIFLSFFIRITKNLQFCYSSTFSLFHSVYVYFGLLLLRLFKPFITTNYATQMLKVLCIFPQTEWGLNPVSPVTPARPDHSHMLIAKYCLTAVIMSKHPSQLWHWFVFFSRWGRDSH